MSTRHMTLGVTDRRLYGSNYVTNRLLFVVSQHVYPSERREFATKRLGISEPRYEMIEEDNLNAWARNFEVTFF